MGKFIIHKNSITEKWSMSDFHSHNYYELYFLTKGSRDLLINNEMYAIKENTIILIPPFISHKTEGGPFERTNFYFPIEFLSFTERKILDKLITQGPILLNPQNDETIFKLLGLIEQFSNTDNNDYDDIIHSLLCTIIILLSEKAKASSTLPQKAQLPQDMVKALSFIKSNYTSNISASLVAKKLFLTTDYFCKKFKKYFNCSFSDYILNLRITEAKKHLQLSYSRIEHIAESVGFSSANYFSLIFKSKVGQSPQAYRKANKVLDYSHSNKPLNS